MTGLRQDWWKHVVAVVAGPVLLAIVGYFFGISNALSASPESLAHASIIVALFSPILFAFLRSLTWPGRHPLAYALMGLLTGLLYFPAMGSYVAIDALNAWQSPWAAAFLLWFYLILFLTGALAGDAIKFLSQYSLRVTRNAAPGTDPPAVASSTQAEEKKPVPEPVVAPAPGNLDKSLTRFVQVMTALAPILLLIGTLITVYVAHKDAILKH